MQRVSNKKSLICGVRWVVTRTDWPGFEKFYASLKWIVAVKQMRGKAFGRLLCMIWRLIPGHLVGRLFVKEGTQNATPLRDNKWLQELWKHLLSHSTMRFSQTNNPRSSGRVVPNNCSVLTRFVTLTMLCGLDTWSDRIMKCDSPFMSLLVTNVGTSLTLSIKITFLSLAVMNTLENTLNAHTAQQKCLNFTGTCFKPLELLDQIIWVTWFIRLRGMTSQLKLNFAVVWSKFSIQ